MVERVVIYATGTPIRPADKAAIDTLTMKVREKNDGLRSLIHEVVQSELFLNK